MKSNKTVIGEILMVCMAFDYSKDDDGEKTLRAIRNKANDQLITCK